MADKKSSVAIFDYQLLEAATNSFSTSRIMRKSGSRIIYRANFDEHFQAAVKKADSDADREFENEVSWLSKMRHQNIIKLMGYCVHGQSRFLVYELVENGSLETQLHGPNRGSSLTWYLRLRIAVDVARALEYLHEHSNPPVVHRDLQSSNVLLDSNFNAKAMPQLTDRSKLPSILDPVIRDTMDLKHLYQVAAVAVLCVQAEPSYRPLITDVLHSLIPLVPVELGGSLRVTEPISSENSH
ncbi:receptor-like protein [Vigna angularis]|uniref:Receptor-like protein n=1 Tax=Phaseolus angularis TaxID=3914 RepID=A0A8T0JFH7_PHAAN|nr:receptor-like protein [Vigna angularis]